MLASFVILHLFSALGIFVAIAYPIWWFLFPLNTPCFFCRTTRVGAVCPTCNEPVVSLERSYPKKTKSAILNALAIFGFTLLALGVVFVEARILRELGYWTPQKTANFVIPARGQYRLGELIPMKIEVTGMETPINAIQADITFNPERVQVLEIDTSESFAEIFLQKEINNELGFARLTGGLPNPGFTGESGIFATVWLQGVQPGLVIVDFLPSSMVLANDSRGTNILQDFGTGNYLILPERISPEAQKLQQDFTSLSPSVLGEQTHTKLVFYEDSTDSTGDVLGLVDEVDATHLSVDSVGHDGAYITSELYNFGGNAVKLFTPVLIIVLGAVMLFSRTRRH